MPTYDIGYIQYNHWVNRATLCDFLNDTRLLCFMPLDTCNPWQRIYNLFHAARCNMCNSAYASNTPERKEMVIWGRRGTKNELEKSLLDHSLEFTGVNQNLSSSHWTCSPAHYEVMLVKMLRAMNLEEIWQQGDFRRHSCKLCTKDKCARTVLHVAACSHNH